jgi:mono/diheme cytochrome c family protein
MIAMLRAGISGLPMLACAGGSAQTPPQPEAPDYVRDIQRLFEKGCYGCHGPQQQMKGLRFDQREVAMRVIQPGNSAASRIIQMVSGAEKIVMPPIGERLSAAQIAMLRAWIDAGARCPETAKPAVPWSFLPVHRPEPPAVRDRDRAWPRNAIDDFVLARLEAEGVAP